MKSIHTMIIISKVITSLSQHNITDPDATWIYLSYSQLFTCEWPWQLALILINVDSRHNSVVIFASLSVYNRSFMCHPCLLQNTPEWEVIWAKLMFSLPLRCAKNNLAAREIEPSRICNSFEAFKPHQLLKFFSIKSCISNCSPPVAVWLI